MAFWADPQVEPKRKYRWLLFLGGIEQWICKKVKKPSFEISETKHEYLIHTFWYPGRLTWKDVTVTLADPVQPDSAATMMQIISAAGYELPVNMHTTATISKKRSIDGLGNVAIHQLDPDGKSIEIWTLYNAWLKDVSMGDLDYSTDEMVDLELTIKYDYAQLDDASLSRAWPIGA